MPYRTPAELWTRNHPWCPVPLNLLLRPAILFPPGQLSPSLYLTLMAIIGLGYDRPDWPTPAISVRQIAQATDCSPKQARRNLHALHGLGIISLIRPDTPGGRSRNRIDLVPLMLLLNADHALHHQVRRTREQTSLPVVTDDPHPDLIAELAARSLAHANRYQPWRTTEPEPVSLHII